MGAPSEQFLRIDYGGPLRSVYSLIMEASILMHFFHPRLDRLLYEAPQVSFLSYNMGAPQALRSLSLFTIWGPPQISFFACHIGGHLRFYFFFTKYMGAPSDQFLRLLYGAPQVSFFSYYMGPRQISFTAYFLGASLRSVFFSY